MDRGFEGSLMTDNHAHPYNRHRVLTIDDLPDDDLLAIFDFYVFKYQYPDFSQLNELGIKRKIESWQSLVHVCRRWRGLVFESTRRLNLQLYCRTRILARKTLDIWPALPLLIIGELYERPVENVIAALEHRDRVRQIDLDCDTTTSQIGKFWTAMQVPFSELAALSLRCLSGPGLPDSFLGGLAPRLRYFHLDGIPFPGLPKLLLSVTHLVHLQLTDIPRSGYISPEAMSTCLSMLISLETLELEFEYRHGQSYPNLNSRRPPSPTRSVLPTLTNFRFHGVNEYLEEFVARIDAPQLHRLSTTLFIVLDFNTPELNQFISRTPTLGACDQARITFDSDEVQVRLHRSHPEPSDHGMVEVKILCSEPDWQLSFVVQFFTLSSRLLLTTENLYIHGSLSSPLVWPLVWENMDLTTWLDLLLPFTAVKNLYLSKLFSPFIALALQVTGRRTTELLPALQNFLLEGFQSSEPVHEGLALFVSARQLTDHPVAISVWDRGFEWDYWS